MRLLLLAVGATVSLALVRAGSPGRDVTDAKGTGKPSRTMAITVDDLPALPASDLAGMRSVTSGVLMALRRHRVVAVGFVNENKLEPATERSQRLALLRAWLADGHELGNHTCSHPDLQRMPLDEYERDVLRGEPGIREVLGARGRVPRYFRHPFTHTGPTAEVRRAFEGFLAAHGYEIAPFSVENADYVFDLLRRNAIEGVRGAAWERLRATYVEHTLAATAHMEGVARETFGDDAPVPQILLIHANGMNAEVLDEVLSRLEARGYRFVTLAEALAHTAWKTKDDYVGPHGPSWLHRFQLAKGRPLRLDLEPDPPRWVLDAYAAAQPR